MKSRDIEGRVERAFRGAAPDVLASVLECTGQKCAETAELPVRNRRKKIPCSRILRTAAVFLLCFILTAAFGQYGRAWAVYSRVCLDAGRSMELKLNRDRELIEARFFDSGEPWSLDMEGLRGKSAGEALNIILDAAVENKSLTQDENSLLISVCSQNPAAAEELRSELRRAACERLRYRGIEASVMSRTAAELGERKSEISPGKLELIKSIERSGSELSFDTMAEMSINELNLALSLRGRLPEGLDIQGEASMGLYLNEEEVRLAAETDLGIDRTAPGKFSMSFGFNEGVPVYKVELESGIYNYSCILDAVSGRLEQCSEDYTGEFNSWLQQQDREFRSWVGENSGELQNWSRSESLISSALEGVGELAGGIADSVKSLIDIFF